MGGIFSTKVAWGNCVARGLSLALVKSAPFSCYPGFLPVVAGAAILILHATAVQ
jgi:hypothetical protein